MEVKLVVRGGKSAGQVVPITGRKFFIGRAEDCQLRPNSDLVSRHHCAILAEEGFVAVRDFGSKNGTFVNGERIRAEQELKSGDRLQIGPLDFEVQLAVDVGGRKKPKVHSVQEAAARTIESSTNDDMDVSQWLDDEDSAGRPSSDTQTLDGRQPGSVVGRTDQPLTHVQPEADLKPQPKDEEPFEDDEEQKKEKPVKVVGKFDAKAPPTDTSRDAAADMLREFFHKK